MKTKICCKCQEEKELNKFYKHLCIIDKYLNKCKKCTNLDSILWHKNNKEKTAAAQHRYYLKNKENLLTKAKIYHKNKSIRQKLLKKIRSHIWILKNKKRLNARNALRQANKIQATPLWSNIEKIKQFYLNCPKGHVIDHIIPLNGVGVCGLHIPYNLQYLTPKENSSKGNRY